MQTPATPDDKPLTVSDAADSAEETQPDSSWSLDRLGEFATEEVNNSFFAEKAAVLQAHKSAVYLFRAGHALFLAREKCKGEKHGDWTKFKKKYALADTSVNDAIRLYQNAKIEDALVGLGITEAKKKFVYPAKSAPSSPSPKPSTSPRKRGKQTAEAGSGSGEAHRDDPEPEDDPEPKTEAVSKDDDMPPQPAEVTKPTDVDPATGIAEELESIAQRLIEISQDDFGKAVWSKAVVRQAKNAVSSVTETLKTIHRKLRNEDV